MTDKEFAALRARLRDVKARGAATIARYEAIKARHDEQAAPDDPALFDAVEQLLVIAREIAAVDDWDFHEECVFCHEIPGYLPVTHKPSCPIARLRTLLGVIPQ